MLMRNNNNLNYEVQKMMLLDKYISPKNEASCFKSIPMSLRYSDEVRNLMMTKKFSIRYRGASCNGYKRNPYHCLKQYATSFAIYPRSIYSR